MRRIGFVVLALLLAQNLPAWEAPQDLSDRVSLVESADAPGHVDAERLTRIFWWLIREQRLQLKPLPRVLVLHLSEKGAGNLGRGGKKVATYRCARSSGGSYYQVWLVGEPTLQEYFIGLQNVILREFELRPTDKELREMLTRLARQERATVDAGSLGSR